MGNLLSWNKTDKKNNTYFYVAIEVDNINYDKLYTDNDHHGQKIERVTTKNIIKTLGHNIKFETRLGTEYMILYQEVNKDHEFMFEYIIYKLFSFCDKYRITKSAINVEQVLETP